MFQQIVRSVYIFAVFFRILVDYLWLDFMERFRSEEARRKAEARAYRRWGRILRKSALRLHGVIIKVCQFLSTRADVLPEAFTRELHSLQDAVPPARFRAIRQRVEEELGAPIPTIFAEFESEALASASLGQVHRARLKEGQTVAVKVLRPGIERLVDIDIAAIRRVWLWIGEHTRLGRRVDMPAIINEFEAITRAECNYIQEAENIRRFRKNFASVPGVDVPYPFDNLVTEKLLVMEFKTGMKLTERDRLHEAGVKPAQVASRLIDAYLKQVLVDGFIHIDPHPGNLLIEADGTLVFIDFGMMGVVTPADRKGIAELARTLLTRDLDGAVHVLGEMGFLRPGYSGEPLKQALALLLDHLRGVKLQPGPEFDRFLEEFREWLFEEPLQFPTRYLAVARALGILGGIVMGLDPNMDLVQILRDQALPMLNQGREQAGEARAESGFDWRKLLADWFGPAAVPAAETALAQARETGLSLIRLPGQVERSLAKLESGSIRVQADLTGVQEQLAAQGRLVNRLTWAVLAAGAAVAGAILRASSLVTEAYIAWGAGGAAMLLLFGNMARGTQRRRIRSPHGKMFKR